jgi:hypothetical protein
MLFSPKNYSQLKTRLKNKYAQKLKLQLKSMKKKRNSSFVAWYLDDQDELKNYTPLKWFFLKQVETYLFLLDHEVPLNYDGGFSEAEDVIFEKWNNSEFADTFLKHLNTGKSVARSSAATLKTFEQHLKGLGERHILKTKSQNSAYRLQPSLGDVSKGKEVTKLLETTLHLEGKELGLMTSSLKEMKHFSHRIEIAVKVIKKFSPSSYERFQAFTETIIPIKQDEFVSFSHQELPGTSMINLYNRDFVDLLDDLLHENGHHHLNYYLNLQTLIKEPIDNIYYSPWRRTLRPLRGIYHAYFTFFWAFKLFSDLARAKEMDSIFYLFSKEEKEKIYFRAVEEFLMLNFTFQELKWARKNELINNTGWKLITEQQKELVKYRNKVVLWEKKCGKFKKDIKALKKTLKTAEKIYFK